MASKHSRDGQRRGSETETPSPFGSHIDGYIASWCYGAILLRTSPKHDDSDDAAQAVADILGEFLNAAKTVVSMDRKKAMEIATATDLDRQDYLEWRRQQRVAKILAGEPLSCSLGNRQGQQADL
jgi:hypothetical protein